MKNLKQKKYQAQSGFTLVELMIVVAIIGILASIAIPNYQKYQAKARTSEAKIQLAAAYTAQKSFYIEYSSYGGCLSAAGYAPDLGSATNPAKRYYATGFNSAASAGATCGPTSGLACETTWSNGNPTCTSGIDGSTAGGIAPGVANGTYFAAHDVQYPNAAAARAVGTNLPATSASSTAFTLGAGGNVNPAVSTTYDQWIVTEGKVVSQSNVGY